MPANQTEKKLKRNNDAQDLSWNAGKKFMGNVDAFLKSLQAFDKDNIPIVCVDKVRHRFTIAHLGLPINYIAI